MRQTAFIALALNFKQQIPPAPDALRPKIGEDVLETPRRCGLQVGSAAVWWCLGFMQTDPMIYLHILNSPPMFHKRMHQASFLGGTT